MTTTGADTADVDRGTVLVTDLRGSTRGLETARQNGRRETYKLKLDEYFEGLLHGLENGATEAGADVLDISYRGDGLIVVTRPSEGVAKLAVALQGVCDKLADQLADEAPQEESSGDTSFDWGTGIGLFTGEVVTVRAREFDGRSFCSSKGFRRRYTGRAFSQATRIEAKARPDRACLSPLIDEGTLTDSDRSGLKVFPVGAFIVDRKAQAEVPMFTDAFPGQPSDYVKLFSAVPEGSILEDAAELFQTAVNQLFSYRTADALQALMDLERFLRENQEQIRTEHGRVALKRWQEALNHYSYLRRSP